MKTFKPAPGCGLDNACITSATHSIAPFCHIYQIIFGNEDVIRGAAVWIVLLPLKSSRLLFFQILCRGFALCKHRSWFLGLHTFFNFVDPSLTGVCMCVYVCKVGTGPDYRDQAEPQGGLTPRAPTSVYIPVGFVLTQALAA